MHIKLLETTHPTYDANAPTWRTISQLDRGYSAIRANVGRWLPRRPSEDDELYQLRSDKLAYTPLLASTIGRYTAKLASSTLVLPKEPDPRLADYRLDNTQSGKTPRSESGLIGEILRNLLLYQVCWVQTDTPQVVPARNRAEELATRYKPYSVVLDPLEVLNWGDGWHVVRSWRSDIQPFTPTISRLRWTLYTADRITAYECTPILSKTTDRDGNIIEVVSGILKGKERIAIGDERCMADLVLDMPNPSGFYSTVFTECDGWLGGQLYPKQIQHLQIESALTDTGYLAGTIQRVYTPLDPVDNQDARAPVTQPDYSTELAKAGNAHILIGKGYNFVESQGSAVGNQMMVLEKIEKQIAELSALHFASGNKGTLQQSGVSKELDMSLLDDSLREYGAIVLTTYNQILAHVCTYIGIEPTVATGLADFNPPSSETLITVIESIRDLGLKPEILDQIVYKLLETIGLDKAQV